MTQPLIELRKVSKKYFMGDQKVYALCDISLKIYRNEFVAITGSSGSGKSTAMNIFGCLDRPSKGRYFLNGSNIETYTPDELAVTRNREIGFVFQTFNLLSKLNAIENVMQPLLYRNVPIKRRRKLAEIALKKVKLNDRLTHLPNQLSGGQRQRVAIARALVTEPSILLADEPTGNLDSQTTEEIMMLFKQLHVEGHTIIIVTHEDEIASRCSRIIELRDGYIRNDKQLGDR